MDSNTTQLQTPDLGTSIVHASGVLLALVVLDSLLGTRNKDTVNYVLKYRGRIVYHGIAYEDRIDARLAEHKMDGKKFDDYRVSFARSREVAQRIERKRIRRDKPCYNIHHNC